MGPRNGDLSANPSGTLIYNEISYSSYSLYFSDSWRIRQTLQCLGPSVTGQCLGASGVDPITAMRIGIDGSTVPIPTFSATAPIPLVPGVTGFPGANQPLASTTYEIDPHYRPGPNNSWN